MWYRWKPSEKVYNGFDNTWDCCSAFGDSIPGEPELDSDDNLKDIYPTVKPQPPLTAPEQATLSTLESVEESTISLYHRDQPASSRPRDIHTPAQEETLDALFSALVFAPPADRGVSPQEDDEILHTT